MTAVKTTGLKNNKPKLLIDSGVTHAQQLLIFVYNVGILSLLAASLMYSSSWSKYLS